MKIAVMVPFYKFLPANSCRCLIQLVSLLGKYGTSCSFISISDTYLHGARERLFELFEKERVKRDYDYILHIDSDQTFSVLDAVNLLRHAEENNFPILCGIYFGEIAGQVMPVLLRRIDGETRKKMAEVRNCSPGDIPGDYYRIASLPNDPFFEVDAGGFGFMACRPKVYDDIKAKFGKPIFAPELEKEGGRVRGEDVVWCERAKSCGYKLMVDRNVMVGHMGGEIGYREYRAWLAETLLSKKTEWQDAAKGQNDAQQTNS